MLYVCAQGSPLRKDSRSPSLSRSKSPVAVVRILPNRVYVNVRVVSERDSYLTLVFHPTRAGKWKEL